MTTSTTFPKELLILKELQHCERVLQPPDEDHCVTDDVDSCEHSGGADEEEETPE